MWNGTSGENILRYDWDRPLFLLTMLRIFICVFTLMQL